MSDTNHSTAPQISVVIPVRDHLEKATKLVDSICSLGSDEASFEIIVVDDGSDPPLPTNLGGDETRVVRMEESSGPAYARNEGAQHARSEILFFMDADVVYPEGAFRAALDLIAEDETIQGISFCNQPFEPEDGWIENFGAVTEWYYEREMLQGARVAEIRALSSRNGVVGKRSFDAIHGFDPAYKTNAHEDYDFGKRLAAMGKLVIIEKPAFYHAFPDMTAKVLRNYWYRSSLFIPYALKYKPKLDPVQISYGEARLRALPGIVMLASTLSLLPLPFAKFWALIAVLALALYGALSSPFLRLCKAVSGSWVFMIQASTLHFLCSLAVCAGGTYGLLSYFIGKKVPDARSSIG